MKPEIVLYSNDRDYLDRKILEIYNKLNPSGGLIPVTGEFSSLVVFEDGREKEKVTDRRKILEYLTTQLRKLKQ